MATWKHNKTDILDWDHSANINSKYSVKYGFTHVEYDEMIRRQNYRCACCGAETASPNGSMRFHVDHCHETRKIRGLLCKACNLGIGLLGDNLEGVMRAVKYLSQTETNGPPSGKLAPRRKYRVKVKIGPDPYKNDGTLRLMYVHPISLDRRSQNLNTKDPQEGEAARKSLEDELNRLLFEDHPENPVDFRKSTGFVVGSVT